MYSKPPRPTLNLMRLVNWFCFITINLLKSNYKAVMCTMFYSDLQLLLDRQQKKCEKLEQNCRDEEANHWQDISKLQEKNKVVCFTKYLRYVLY